MLCLAVSGGGHGGEAVVQATTSGEPTFARGSICFLLTVEHGYATPFAGRCVPSELDATLHVKRCRAVVGTCFQAPIERRHGASEITLAIRCETALKVRGGAKLRFESCRRVEI